MKKGIYKHYKGNLYELMGVANHSETLEKMVLYKALYGEGEIWARPILMWDEKVLVNGEYVPRFKYISDEITVEKSCGAICWRKKGDKPEYLILFQKGSETWSFPKGHMEKRETKPDTARREVFEETGVRAEVDVSFEKTLSYTLKSGNVKYLTLFLAEINGEIKLAENEASEYRWVNLKEAESLLPKVGYKEILNEAEEYINKKG